MESNLPVIVVLKGGIGSGHFGHRGRPGEVGGSLPEGSASKKVAEVRFEGTENYLDPEEQAMLKSELTKYADEFGFPRNKLIFNYSEGDEFTVAGERYTKAAIFNQKTGEITLYRGSIPYVRFENKEGEITNFDRSIIAHEVMHHRFHEFERQLHRQEALINKLGVGLDDNPVLQDDFTLKPEYREQYWAVDIKQRYYQYANMRDLLFQIPVTNYGKSYIEEAKTATYGLAVTHALSENLAEIAAYADNPYVYISTRWSKLYNEINQGLYEHKLIPKYVPLSRSK
jgi:hypothetical protein